MKMEKQDLENFEKAQLIAAQVWGYSKPLVVKGVKLLDLAEKIEKKILDLGGKPSWPVNISVNDMAAHYTPGLDDNSILNEGDLAKVDFGVHVDGWISDNAYTVCIGKKAHPMIEASEKALEAGLKAVKPGVKVAEVSAIIEDIVAFAG
ncbi:M24 family metallopeptidase, partial [archaeon]